MKSLLLDENIPLRFRYEFSDHRVAHVVALKWAGIKNGALLTQAEAAGFDVLLTLDSNLSYQNSLAGRSISVLLLRPQGQGVQALRALVPSILAQLRSLEPGTFSIVTAER
jgi:predicted nuclease of predicted toxin-antitoxin system